MSNSQPPHQEQQPALFCSIGSPTTSISKQELRETVEKFLESLGARDDVLLLPPDFTRFHSQAGTITRFISEYYNFTEREEDAGDSSTRATSASSPSIQIIPALGTHAPMKNEQIELMFGSNLANKKTCNRNDDSSDSSPFVVHNWRDDVVTIGFAPEEMVEKATHGMVREKWPAQLNKLVWEKRIQRESDSSKSNPQPLVLSIGQVVPHEVTGMANYNKNLFVGVGGVEAINLSHFIGAVHGMEKLMGRGNNPLREILNYSSSKYLEPQLDLWYILTVMGPSSSQDSDDDQNDGVEMKGLFIGRDVQAYDLACDLSLKVNFNLLDRSPKKIVVYLNEEYHSTWLGNKSIYRTRMAIDDGGELIVLAPWVETFGEDDCIDSLIRKVGYVGTPGIMQAMENDDELKSNLSAVAHLIHGSSEGRFSVTYCPGKLTKEEVESVGYKYSDLEKMKQVYNIETLKDGWNTRTDENGSEEEFYYISNPALGLWAHPSRFEEESDTSDAAQKHGDVTISSNQEASDGSGGVGGWKKPPRKPDCAL
ncbi:putative lactate racemase-like protein [Skeletonema marinoi]|uniref:Lactate racemase-like protein n=1 Tax=Skeletonema marinoi TaxID=267567 RepID=A0AAD8Y982_9STRA|nr:putative lactate racemase-like protein [Skeletonema marinoi]